MGSSTPIHWMILALIAVLVFAISGQIRALLHRRRKGGDRPAGQRRFLDGMTPVTSFALAGAMLLALGLLTDVYTPGAVGEDLSLALSGSGAVFTLVSLFLDRRSRNRS